MESCSDMNPHFPAVTFTKISLISCSILSLIGLAQMKSQLGTTPNIRDIVVGRCYVYNALIDPSLRLDCVKMWRQFEDAVVLQSSCNVTVDYLPIFYTVPQSGPCHRSLFWSKTRKLMHSYAAAVGTFWTLEDTLIGFLFNDLHWCGQHKNPGFDFSSCPMWSTCRNHPMYSLWRQASESVSAVTARILVQLCELLPLCDFPRSLTLSSLLQFAETACGNVTVLLNGSIVNAFDRNSMLGSVEVNGLRPEKVEYVNIKVAADQQGPYIESCHRGSVLDLIQILQSRGFQWTCTDSDQCRHLFPQNPDDSPVHPGSDRTNVSDLF
ncbi:ADP-ribosyl cyclase/cyclic ADP-ribose hydrolase 1-like isoform X2 [Cynoglossus semilaevis]|uniref:ADP-ribosyl cyclase/cyclic ADP-ribose hydrolase 1-like isoform X2 n=1 Tax=Cynoglossus semilaevis TaxID=244447 RepID=UPI000D623E8A|nr:ADP-ribosyl cyclase/cyclic ADP-ribose hydrolase 1-like isoform X2 [Cynoglossus semilaevis]